MSYQADEAYQVGKGLTPVAAYLAQDAIIKIALEHGVDMIHPGSVVYVKSCCTAVHAERLADTDSCLKTPSLRVKLNKQAWHLSVHRLKLLMALATRPKPEPLVGIFHSF